jgi:hypothetical protein
MTPRCARALFICLLVGTHPAYGQTARAASDPRAITADGVLRASALVDSVFVNRQLPAATVDAGDFTAYLMARLGVRDLPPALGYTVTADTSLIRIGGRISDLPSEAQLALGQLVLLLPPDTRLCAEVELSRAGKEAVRFHLHAVTVQEVPIPETFLISMMANIGRQYPALTSTGRDLYVQVPAGAMMTLVPGGVALTGP